MDISAILKLTFFLSLLTQSTSHADIHDCQPSVRQPFQIQSKHCGLPGFKLFCKHNQTIINFPNYGDLLVKSISYDTKRLNLIDPNNCVHEVFLNLNLSETPFRYYHVLKQYKYINCSSKIPIPLVEFVPCLSSDSTHSYVYTVELSFLVPGYCKTVKSVGIPFSYSSYLSDNSFGLGLTWDSTGENAKIKALGIQTFFKASGKITALILMVGILLYAKIPQRCMELSGKKIEGKLEADIISQGQYEALNPPKDEDRNLTGLFCIIVDNLIRSEIYSDYIQTHLAPSGYLKLPNNIAGYLSKCRFLPKLNNELPGERNSTYKERFSSLKKLVLIMFEHDTVLIPKETAWFGYYPDGSFDPVLPPQQTKLYMEDWIGLKSLDDAGRVEYVKVPGNHLGIAKADMKKYIVPYLEDDMSKDHRVFAATDEKHDTEDVINFDQPSTDRVPEVVGLSSYRWPLTIKNFFGEMLGVTLDE
ncbi:palmitoyl-protein thioesterase 1 [Dorcoceras hygrometricum]|uniref:Palmitoyl-protein thioesterase 1 n=1 Tax=Dorcoceras hygrometricum TaxID=472368 RepID=A0A2Z7D3I7_9LAMI|nr:palmitoyl-protein thioesterase 1 [Dorcoceras hygrometricum]